MRDIALYYPYIHVRDDTWLKAAALYWPRIARLTPTGYPRHDSETARRLSGELDFILNIDPRQYARPVATEFNTFIKDNREALQSRYRIPGALMAEDPEDYRPWAVPSISPEGELFLQPTNSYFGLPKPNAYDGNHNIGWIHTEKMTTILRDALIQSGLGTGINREWVVVAPVLAAVYTAALAERVAISNDLAVVTDRQRAHGILNGWDMEKLASALLSDDEDDDPALETDEIGALYAAVAVKTVVPAGLDNIPVDKIIHARRALAAEFDAFRDHLSLLADRLTELSKIKDLSVLQARLELMVERDLRRPTQELEGKLRQLGLEPAQAVLGLKSLELPAAAAAAASAAALPPGVGQAGMVAARLIASGVQSRTQRSQMLRSSPAGYLLGLEKQLTPGGVIERLRRTICRVGKTTRPSTG